MHQLMSNVDCLVALIINFSCHGMTIEDKILSQPEITLEFGIYSDQGAQSASSAPFWEVGDPNLTHQFLFGFIGFMIQNLDTLWHIYMSKTWLKQWFKITVVHTDWYELQWTQKRKLHPFHPFQAAGQKWPVFVRPPMVVMARSQGR